MRYIVGLVDEEIDRLPNGRICGAFEDTYVDSYMEALLEANFEARRHPDREVIICRETDFFNREDDNPELTILWSSRDDDYLKKNYLEFTSEEWKHESFGHNHKQSDSPSIYIDIDGTLGKWYADNRGYESLEEILDPANHYFRDIDPHPFMIELARILHEEGYDVCIISAAERDTIRDKAEWIEKHLPFIPKENIFFSPLGADKTHFVKGNAKKSVLIDDYRKNLDKWPGIAIKAINSVNSHQEKYPEIDMTRPERIMEKYRQLQQEGNAYRPEDVVQADMDACLSKLKFYYTSAIKTIVAELQSIEIKPEKLGCIKQTHEFLARDSKGQSFIAEHTNVKLYEQVGEQYFVTETEANDVTNSKTSKKYEISYDDIVKDFVQASCHKPKYQTCLLDNTEFETADDQCQLLEDGVTYSIYDNQLAKDADKKAQKHKDSYVREDE